MVEYFFIFKINGKKENKEMEYLCKFIRVLFCAMFKWKEYGIVRYDFVLMLHVLLIN